MSDALAGARKVKYRPRRLERPAECSFCGAHLPAYTDAYCADRFPKVVGLHRLFACKPCARKRGWNPWAGVEHLAVNPDDFARQWTHAH